MLKNIALLSFTFLPIAYAQPHDVQTSPPTEEVFTLESSINLRDPFKKYHAKSATGDDLASIPILERYELDKFKLVGVISGKGRYKAMLSAPDDKMHVVSIGTTMGTRKGVIRDIDQGQIVVEEKVVNLLGQEEKVETVIEIKNEAKTGSGG